MTDFFTNFYSAVASNEANYDGDQDDYYYQGAEVMESLSAAMILEGRADDGIYLFMFIAALLIFFVGLFLVAGIIMGFKPDQLKGTVGEISG